MFKQPMLADCKRCQLSRRCQQLYLLVYSWANRAAMQARWFSVWFSCLCSAFSMHQDFQAIGLHDVLPFSHLVNFTVIVSHFWQRTSVLDLLQSGLTRLNGSMTLSGASPIASFSDINECATGSHDCHASATCTNTNGSHTCNCNHGYRGNGRHCTG